MLSLINGHDLLLSYNFFSMIAEKNKTKRKKKYYYVRTNVFVSSFFQM